MANPAQCYYCFETLAASFDGRGPINLSAIEDLWEQHEQVKKIATLQDRDEPDSLSSRDDPSLQQTTEEDGANVGSSRAKASRPHVIKLPSIGRLQGELSSDSSSASTTPSTNSESSSSTTITTPGSQTDAAGPRHRKGQNRQYPLFVTWNTLSKSGNKSLRGCIGTFEAQELSAGLKSYALTSYVFTPRVMTNSSPFPTLLLTCRKIEHSMIPALRLFLNP